jgi:hypothetical protein
MTELLALPEWNAPPRTLADWSEQLAQLGHSPHLEQESGDAAWLEIAPLRLRGYALIEGELVTAINFQLAATDPQFAASVVLQAAQALGWELHDDDGGEDGDDTDLD